jgi:hypothetical protein
MNTTANLPDDYLDRTAFLGSVQRHIDDLAKTRREHLPAPRLLAVDAPWGNGKSWIASRLHEQLRGEAGRRVALIDAFHFDHHDDAFAVIAAAILGALKPEGTKRRDYLISAGKVLKSAVPIAVKAALRLGTRAVGIDAIAAGEVVKDVVEEAIDSASDLSEQAVEALFKQYNQTQETQQAFINTLGELTEKLDKPFVVLIDELDRCRPSFALEVLERIKHLFAAENVVFVCFWNAQAIHESIRHTYGRGTKAERYLSKFVALSLNLPWPDREDNGPESRYANFIHRTMRRTDALVKNSDDFRHALGEYAAALDASLREVEKAIQVFKLAWKEQRDFGECFAYFVLLSVVDKARFEQLSYLNPIVIEKEVAELAPHLERKPCPRVERIWAVLIQLRDPARFEAETASSVEAPTADIKIAYKIMTSDKGGGLFHRDMFRNQLQTYRDWMLHSQPQIAG